MESNLTSTPPIAAIRDEELLNEAKPFVYKKTHEGELTLHCFYPEGHNKEDYRSSIVLFHGGKWDNSTVAQFIPQALNFVSLGMVGIVAEYRTKESHQTDPFEAISDAQTAVLWIRKNNRHLGIDPEKIIAGGSGSGAHIALCSAMHKKVENDGFFSGKPNALVLWSAIVDTTKRGVGYELFTHKRDARKTSPSKNVRRKLPPMIFFHGKEDPIVPISSVEKFCQRLTSKRNTALFVPFARATHSFFNFNVNQNYFIHTLESAEGFLIDQGFLTPLETDVVG